MPVSWDVLTAAGVPAGPVRPRGVSALDERVLREGLEDLGPSLGDLSENERDAVRAWLCAFRHHWPEAFERTTGACGPLLLASLGEPSDRNRHIKLRRIAIENLAHLF